MFAQLYSLALAAFNWETVAIWSSGEWRAVEPQTTWWAVWQFASQNYWLQPVVDFWFGPNACGAEVLNFYWR